jgi:hypothetical protein
VALTGPERAQVRKYLGWTTLTGSGEEATSLERSMDAIDTRPDDEAEVRVELQRALDADAFIEAQYQLSGKATQVGSIQLRVHYQVAAAIARGREAVVRMAAMLDVAIMPGAAFHAGVRSAVAV